MVDDRFALITGTTSGLGKAMALHLLDEGYIVFGMGRSGSDIDHGNFIDLITDITDELAVEEAFAIMAESTDYLDLIVNNAGICLLSPLQETSSKEFLLHLKTNVLGHFHILKHGMDFVAHDKTHVITISSEASQKPWPEMSAYCASQFALDGLMQTCQLEWKKLGVRFSTLRPGIVNTPLWDDQFNEENADNKMMEVDDFLWAFNMVINSPDYIQFPVVNFSHKE